MNGFGLQFHLPKTGGNATLTTLKKGGAQIVNSGHRPYEEVCAHYLRAREHKPAFPEFGAVYKFGFVRNPWDRHVSYYHHGERDRAIVDPAVFEKWLRSSFIKTLVRGTAGPMFCEEGVCRADFVGQYENLSEGVAHVATQMGVRVEPLAVKNPGKRPTRGWRQYYTEFSYEIVEQLGAWEIERFGYTFNDPETPGPLTSD